MQPGNAARVPRRRLSAPIAVDLLARSMYVLAMIERGNDGLGAAELWDDDALLTDTYEEWEARARDAVYAEMEAREHGD